MMRKSLLLISLLLLAACSANAPRRLSPQAELLAAQNEREAVLAQRSHWQLSGRIAVSDGRDGGSGQVQWAQNGEAFDIRLKAPVTRRSWRLTGAPGWARLEGLEGGPFHAESAETLLAEHLGWFIPLHHLVAWVQGARAPGAAQINFQPSGLPAEITQNGWQIEYRSFGNDTPIPMPQRVFASRGSQRVRMQVDAWKFP